MPEIAYLIFAGAICFIIGWLNNQRRARHREAAQSQLVAYAVAINALPKSEYLPRSIVEEWTRDHAHTVSLAQGSDLARYLPSDRSDQYQALREHLRDVPKFIRTLNEAFIKQRLEDDKDALDRVERYPLTDRQRRAVVVDENNTFVVAGAGTGKTSTIVDKVDYLTRRGLAPPGEILGLAYGRKAAIELVERFGQFAGAGSVEASTFHALGRRIVSRVEGHAPTLSVYAEDDRALVQFISSRLVDQLGDTDFAFNLIRLFSDLLDEEEDPTAQSAPGEVQRLRAMGLRD